MIRRGAAALCALALAGVLAACSGGSDGGSVSVFTVTPGECFATPGSIKAELSSLPETPCTSPHTQEAYAIVPYASGRAAVSDVAQGTNLIGKNSALSAYPGQDVLTTYAQGVCAQRFQSYVGVDYLDSSLYYTYLLPSARSWEQADDRNVICFVTTTGRELTKSVKGSRL